MGHNLRSKGFILEINFFVWGEGDYYVSTLQLLI